MDVVGVDLLQRAGPAHQVDVVSPDIHQKHPDVLAPKVPSELQQRSHAVHVHRGDRREVHHHRTRMGRLHP
jgi:hypothetical protein